MKLVKVSWNCETLSCLKIPAREKTEEPIMITRTPPQEGNGNNERQAFHRFILLDLVGLLRPRYSKTALIALSSIINSQ